MAGWLHKFSIKEVNVEMFARLSDSFMFGQIYSQQNIFILFGQIHNLPYQNWHFSEERIISLCHVYMIIIYYTCNNLL